jgi:hypothetical protein
MRTAKWDNINILSKQRWFSHLLTKGKESKRWQKITLTQSISFWLDLPNSILTFLSNARAAWFTGVTDTSCFKLTQATTQLNYNEDDRYWQKWRKRTNLSFTSFSRLGSIEGRTRVFRWCKSYFTFSWILIGFFHD